MTCPQLPDLPSGFDRTYGTSFNNNGNPVFCEGDFYGKDCYELTTDLEYVYFGSLLLTRNAASYVQLGQEFWVLGRAA
mgnify:CR=1 FL=1